MQDSGASILIALINMSTKKSSLSYLGPLMAGFCKCSSLLQFFAECTTVNVGTLSLRMAVPSWSHGRDTGVSQCVSLCISVLSRWISTTACQFWRDLKDNLASPLCFSEGERRGFAQRDTGGLCQGRAVSANTLAIIPLPCEWAIENSGVRGGKRACIVMMG